MLSRIGPHELKPTPDDVLVALQPQFMVTVGTYEHPDAINRHRARVQYLKALLPNTLIGVRWWPDDNILNTVTPDGFARLFFKLHVDGTVMFVGNEDANSHGDPMLLADTVAKHVAVARLGTAAGIPLGLCCLSTGNPAFAQYPLLLPFFEVMAEGRERGVVHWFRLNRYRTASDTSHFLEHEAALRGIPLPPLLIGEVGAVKSYAEPEAGYLAMGWSEEQYTTNLAPVVKKYPFAFYCEGEGVYDTHWKHFKATPKLWTLLASGIERTPKTAYQEWHERNAQVTQPTNEHRATVLPKDGLNLRPTATTKQPKIETIPFEAEFTVWLSPVIDADAYKWVKAAYNGKVGFVAMGVNNAPTFKVIEEPAPEPEDPPMPPVEAVCSENLTDDEIHQLITLHTDVAAFHVNLGASHTKMARIYSDLRERRQKAPGGTLPTITVINEALN